MSRALIGRTVRRLRTERRLTQQALAVRLGISASYLNLIEHDQRTVTASLLIKLGETLGVDLATLSGRSERQLEVTLREAFADPLLSAEAVRICAAAKKQIPILHLVAGDLPAGERSDPIECASCPVPIRVLAEFVSKSGSR